MKHNELQELSCPNQNCGNKSNVLENSSQSEYGPSRYNRDGLKAYACKRCDTKFTLSDIVCKQENYCIKMPVILRMLVSGKDCARIQEELDIERDLFWEHLNFIHNSMNLFERSMIINLPRKALSNIIRTDICEGKVAAYIEMQSGYVADVTLLSQKAEESKLCNHTLPDKILRSMTSMFNDQEITSSKHFYWLLHIYRIYHNYRSASAGDITPATRVGAATKRVDFRGLFK